MEVGQTLSHYRITAAIGAGGMGEVYRATDTTLQRDVAIKVLPPEVVQDPGRLARFKREAQLLAALNHPGIGAIYGLEEADGGPFLALELVEGEDLKERLGRGPIPVDEAIDIGRQIAEALEEAHSNGIVHRDLKPANVKLAASGRVKVLDFGLAKAWAGDNPSTSGTVRWPFSRGRSPGDQAQLTWVDRQGRPIEPVGAPGSFGQLALSPDGRRVAYDTAANDSDLWVMDLARGVTTRIGCQGWSPQISLVPIRRAHNL